MPEKGAGGGRSVLGRSRHSGKENIDYTPNQCKMLTELRVGKAGNQIASPEPCQSVGVTIHTCKSTSTEQRLKDRRRPKMARKRLQLRLRIRVASIIINIKTLKLSLYSGSQVLCFLKRNKPQIPLCQKTAYILF